MTFKILDENKERYTAFNFTMRNYEAQQDKWINIKFQYSKHIADYKHVLSLSLPEIIDTNTSLAGK